MERVTARWGVRALVITAFLLMGLTAGSGTVRAESIVDTGRTLLEDLSVDSDPRTVALRVPLSTFADVGLGAVRPFATAGTRSAPGGSLEESLRLLVDQREAPQGPQGQVELGAGLVWKAGDRVEIFGEYRFLNLGRAAEPPSFKAGLTIRLF